MNVLDIVKGNVAVMTHCQDEVLWYSIDFIDKSKNDVVTARTFKFPIPTEDTVGAKFLPKDKAMLFMRWINRELKRLASESPTEKMLRNLADR